MFIDERIFRELEVVEHRSFEDYRSDEDWSDSFMEILYELAEKEIIDEKDDYEDECDWQDRVSDEASDIIRVVRFDGDGLLALALYNYYGGHENMINSIRSCVDNYIRDGYVYYVTGVGYDTINADLLNGNMDGRAKYEFIAEINKDNEDKDRVEHYKKMSQF